MIIVTRNLKGYIYEYKNIKYDGYERDQISFGEKHRKKFDHDILLDIRLKDGG